MAQPIWLTPAGSLGTIPEGLFYQVPLLAVEPEISIAVISVATTGSQVTFNFSTQATIPFLPGTAVQIAGFDPVDYNGRYTVISATTSSVTVANATTAAVIVLGQIQVAVQFQVIAGELPAGIQVEASGLLEGVPLAIASVQGVPQEVARDVVSKFAIRAYTETVVNGITVINRLADRTFTLTVTGQDAPEFITPAGNLATFYDGSLVEGIQIEYTDTDPGEIVTVKLVAGSLPPGLSISPTGLISGFIQPVPVLNGLAGYSRDGQGYDEFPFDFATQSINQNYQFVLEVSDGINTNLRTFDIFVYSRNSLTADDTEITADNTFVTADVTPVRTPIVLTPQGTIGVVQNDNYFAFQFTGIDLDGDQFEFVAFHSTPEETAGTGIPGLTLDPKTGWLYGYIPDLGQTEVTYNFYIRVFKSNDPAAFSNNYDYSLSINGSINTTVIWLTESFLGRIDNGSVSTFYVEAENVAGIPLLYRLQSGSDSSLPQGLQLLATGEIAGRVSFNTFALDSNTTTFDVGSRGGETTFDLTNTFTVNAYSADGLVSVFRTFTIQVVRRYNEPYENLYIEAMPPFDSRAIITQLLNNTDIFPPDLIYRSTDPNFGLATRVVYDHAFGLTAATLDEYVESLNLNHYWKTLTLGNIKTARALNPDGTVLYEVVYSEIIDNLVNNNGETVGKEVVLPFPITGGDSTELAVVYPNGLVNMRDQVIDVVGQISNVLPRWMLSVQDNGQVLGFVPAWVICYTKPGRSGQIAYNIQTQFGEPLNKIDFEVDRYELDRLLSKNWDTETQNWTPSPPTITTFDYGTIVSADTWINTVGNSVTWINNRLDPVSWSSTYTGQPTVFDHNSLQFTDPVDMYEGNTQIYDKYLVFPKRNILG
jgi:hypothetical protein